MENVDDPHNISACMRSCDAVGIQDLYIIWENKPQEFISSQRSSSSASKWLTINVFDNTETAFKAIKKKYNKIYTTHLATDSKGLHEMNFTENCALVFGNEKDGVSKKAVDLADGNFIIPQVGMIQSLNISVACAVTLYEVYRQRVEAGFYDSVQLKENEYNNILTKWIENRKFRKLKD